MKSILVVFAISAAVLFAQEPVKKPAQADIPAATASQIELLNAQRAAASAPFDALLADLKALTDKVKQMQVQAVGPVDNRVGKIFLELCASVGVNEDQARAGQCVVDTDAKTVKSKLPATPDGKEAKK